MWKQRVLLVGEFMKGEQQMAELCRSFGVSRKTAYKWGAYYKADGSAGLADRSRAPLTHATRVAPDGTTSPEHQTKLNLAEFRRK